MTDLRAALKSVQFVIDAQGQRKGASPGRSMSPIALPGRHRIRTTQETPRATRTFPGRALGTRGGTDRKAIVTATLTPLQSAGNSPKKAGWLDSYFGPVTERAVIKFQRDNQLRPDGMEGPQTQNLLLLRNQQILKLPNSW